MAAIITRRKWTRQPGRHAELDLAHPALAGVQFFHHFNGNTTPQNLAGPNYSLTASGSPVRKDSADGVGLGLTAASSQSATFGTGLSIAAPGDFTAFAYATWDTSGANTSGRLFSYRGSSGNTILAAGVGPNGLSGNANAPSFLTRDDATTIKSVAFTNTVTDGRPHLWVMQRTNDVITGWLDTSSSSTSGAGNGAFTTTAADTAYGVDPLNLSLNYWNGVILYAGLVTRFWDASIISGLVESPWQLFAPHARRLYFGAAGGATNHATLTGAGALSGVGASIARAVATYTGKGSLTAVGAALAKAIVSAQGTGALNAAGAAKVAGAVAFHSAGTLNAAGHALVAGHVAFSGAGALNGVAPRTVAGAASFGGGAALNAVASPTRRGTGDGAKWSRYVIEEFKRQEAARKKREEEEREEQAALPQVAFDVIATRPIVTDVAVAPAARTTLAGIIGRPTVLDVDVELADFREMMSMIAELGQEA